jgi:hypothetical protein
MRVNRGAVRQIRVALNTADPPVTRVVLDLFDSGRYGVESAADPREMRIVVETRAAAPVGSSPAASAASASTRGNPPAAAAHAEDPESSGPPPPNSLPAPATGTGDARVVTPPQTAAPPPTAAPSTSTARRPAPSTRASDGTASWCLSIADRVAALLDAIDEPSANEGGLVTANPWAELEREVAGRKVPNTLLAAHSLLLEAVRLGQIAALRRDDGARAAEAAAAKFGARMLLTRARTLLEDGSPRS